MKEFFHRYKPDKDHFDEYLNTDGLPRESWRRFHKIISQFDKSDILKRQETIERIIQENGITYNIYDDNLGQSHPWMMDILPMMLSNNEFLWLENALNQRIRLFNEVLQDIYSKRNLIRAGILPPELIFANPGYQRACSQLNPQQNHPPIQIYAADLARSPDGRWWVVSDRLDAPSGIGYAMENRFITNRVMPDIFKNTGVIRVQSFFNKLRESLTSAAVNNTENPKVVLLTPGPANETYFEQSFLARNLDFPLVEGADLTVRDNRVFLKTIKGMEPVNVIWRRVDSSFCDPLELSKDSLLGVPGLLNAIREGNVSVVNGIGAGVLESAVFKAFLPNLCKHLFNEDLMMPSLATWWCGQESERAYVLQNFNKLVIKPAFKTSGFKSVFGQNLSAEECDFYNSWIRNEPTKVCAQEMMTRATTPVFSKNGIESRHFLLRVFLVAHNGSYSMMPGGLTRITNAPDSMKVSMQQGGQSKDTWILASDTSKQEQLLMPNSGPLHLQRNMNALPSRVADHIFWFGRYIERTEHMVRLLRMLIEIRLDENVDEFNYQKTIPFFESLTSPFKFKEFLKSAPLRGGFPKTETLLEEYFWNSNQTSSLQSTIRAMINNAYAVKERMSLDTWFIISRIQKIYQGHLSVEKAPIFRQSTLTELNELLTFLAGINGMASENMTRYHDWRLLDLGKRFERLNNIIAITENSIIRDRPNQRDILYHLLIYADSLYTYRGRYLTNMKMEGVLDLLWVDETNPRSAAYQTNKILDHIRNLPQFSENRPSSSLEKLAIQLYSDLRLLEIDPLVKTIENGQRIEIEKFADKTLSTSYELSEILQNQYFAHGKTGEFNLG